MVSLIRIGKSSNAMPDEVFKPFAAPIQMSTCLMPRRRCHSREYRAIRFPIPSLGRFFCTGEGL